MYLWKCWLEYRKALLVAVLLAAGFVCMGDYYTISYAKVATTPRGNTLISEPYPAQHHSPDFRVLNQAMHGGGIILFSILSAIFLSSAGGMGREPELKTTEFLFTRPRRRRSLLWTNWCSGMLAVEVVALVPLIIWMVLTHSLGDSYLFTVLLVTLPLSMLLFGIALICGVLLRSAPKGGAITLLAYVMHVSVVSWLHTRYQIETPDWWIDKLDQGMQPQHAPIPWMHLALWAAISLVFPYLTQKILEHRDVT